LGGFVQLSTELVGDVGVIHVQGEVDIVQAPKLTEVASEMLGNGARSVVVDGRDIEFIDLSGVRALVTIQRRAEDQGGTVTLRQPSALTYRLLQATLLDTVLLIDGVPQPYGS
jgi:anti-sigma B factor antagonist